MHNRNSILHRIQFYNEPHTATTQTTLYSCKICKKIFAGPGTLKIHLRTHADKEDSVTARKKLVRKSKKILKNENPATKSREERMQKRAIRRWIETTNPPENKKNSTNGQEEEEMGRPGPSGIIKDFPKEVQDQAQTLPDPNEVFTENNEDPTFPIIPQQEQSYTLVRERSVARDKKMEHHEMNVANLPDTMSTEEGSDITYYSSEENDDTVYDEVFEPDEPLEANEGDETLQIQVDNMIDLPMTTVICEPNVTSSLTNPQGEKIKFRKMSEREKRMRNRENTRGDAFPTTLFDETNDTVLIVKHGETELGATEEIPICKKYRCDFEYEDQTICGLSFEQTHELIAHRLGHKNSGVFFQCANCQLKFTDIDELSEHVKEGTCQEAEVPIQDDDAYAPLRKSNKIEFNSTSRWYRRW